MVGQAGSTGMNLQSTITEKDFRDRILEQHQKPVVEDASLPVSKEREHIGDTMLREYQSLRDEFIMTWQAKKSIGALKIPVDINAGGKIIPTIATAIYIDDDPSTKDEVIIKAETLESFGNGGRSHDSYTITYQEEGDKLVKKMHHGGYTEDAMGDIGMGGGSEVVYMLDKTTGDIEYYPPFGGKEVIHNSVTQKPGASGENFKGASIPSEVLEDQNIVMIDGIALPRNSECYFAPGNLMGQRRNGKAPLP
jgi:hypothetical protein